jgi:phosphoglycerol transferase MdoB-like AlkP superfamily enzyme
LDEQQDKLKEAMAGYAAQAESEITKRHQADMTSDSWLSKNVRPIVLIFTIVSCVLMAIFHGNIGQFKIDPAWIQTLQIALTTMISFYFGSRGFEKVASIKAAANSSDDDDNDAKSDKK